MFVALLAASSPSPLMLSILVGLFVAMLCAHFLDAMPTWTPVAAADAVEQAADPVIVRDTLPTGKPSPLPSLPSVLAYIRTIDEDPNARMYAVDVRDGGYPYYTMARDTLDAIDRVIDDIRDMGESAPCPLTCQASIVEG